MRSFTLYKNRYDDEYHWHPVDDNTYELRMEGKSIEYATVGFKRMEEDEIDYTDLRCFEPSGGPFIDYETVIDGRRVCHIEKHNGSFYVEVSN